MSKTSINKDKLIEKSEFIKEWKKVMTSTMNKINPLWDEDDIENILNEMLIDNIQIPEATMDNNYTGESRDTNIISIFDWVLTRKPLVAGNGTFYKNQIEAINPVAQMLDGFLKERKAIKKEMFKVEDKTSDLYKDLDRA